jgi:hypothetical protein
VPKAQTAEIIIGAITLPAIILISLFIARSRTRVIAETTNGAKDE